jgi:excisionase family DNA binding protein
VVEPGTHRFALHSERSRSDCLDIVDVTQRELRRQHSSGLSATPSRAFFSSALLDRSPVGISLPGSAWPIHKRMTATETAQRRLLRADEVAERLQLTKATVYGLIRRGALPGVRVGGSVRVDPAELERFLREEGRAT